MAYILPYPKPSQEGPLRKVNKVSPALNTEARQNEELTRPAVTATKTTIGPDELADSVCGLKTPAVPTTDN